MDTPLIRVLARALVPEERLQEGLPERRVGIYEQGPAEKLFSNVQRGRHHDAYRLPRREDNID